MSEILQLGVWFFSFFLNIPKRHHYELQFHHNLYWSILDSCTRWDLSMKLSSISIHNIIFLNLAPPYLCLLPLHKECH